MMGAETAALSTAIALGAALAAGTGQYTTLPQPSKGKRTRPGNNIAKARKKAKSHRTAQRAARRAK